MFIYNRTSDNGELERQETLIGEVHGFCVPPLPTGFSSNIGTKEPLYEERKRYYRNSSPVSQVSAVQAQASASSFRTPSDCSDRLLRHCRRFKCRTNRVPVHKSASDVCNVKYQIFVSIQTTAQIYEFVSISANSVNCILTFEGSGKIMFFQKIAAKFFIQIYNYLNINEIKNYNKKIVVLNVVGSSPTGHPTIKPVDYQVISRLFYFLKLAFPPWHIHEKWVKMPLFFQKIAAKLPQKNNFLINNI